MGGRRMERVTLISNLLKARLKTGYKFPFCLESQSAWWKFSELRARSLWYWYYDKEGRWNSADLLEDGVGIKATGREIINRIAKKEVLYHQGKCSFHLLLLLLIFDEFYLSSQLYCFYLIFSTPWWSISSDLFDL